MANSITGFTTFVTRTVIQSAPMNTNLAALKNMSPLWQKYTIPYTSFTALGATATGSVDLFSITAAEILDAFAVKHSTAFSGGAISAVAVKVGKTGTTDHYTDEFDVFQAVGSAAHQMTQNVNCEFSSTTAVITMSLTGGNLSSLSQGSVDVYVRRAEIP